MATTSPACFCSFSRTDSSTAISSKGFIDILTAFRSTPVLSSLTRILRTWTKAEVAIDVCWGGGGGGGFAESERL